MHEDRMGISRHLYRLPWQIDLAGLVQRDGEELVQFIQIRDRR